jgi:hypothetical protein
LKLPPRESITPPSAIVNDMLMEMIVSIGERVKFWKAKIARPNRSDKPIIAQSGCASPNSTPRPMPVSEA